MDDLEGDGWALRQGPGLLAWARAASAPARAAVLASGTPWRAGGTWFVGLDALENGADGAVGGVAFPWAELGLPVRPLHPGQLSVTRPGYPRADPGQDAAAFGYVKNRDSAHLDGLLPLGPARRRHVCEPHAHVVGIALTRADVGASPLVVWPGSHRILGPALSAHLRAALARGGAAAAAALADVDVTDVYQAARRQCFDTCPRLPVVLAPGQAVILHRHLLHGVAPWADGAAADDPGRMIAYFRPAFDDPRDWLWPIDGG